MVRPPGHANTTMLYLVQYVMQYILYLETTKKTVLAFSYNGHQTVAKLKMVENKNYS